MFDVRTVLVPVDFSACSLAALEHAVALAAPRRGAIHLLHVVEPIVSGLGEGGPIATGVLTRFQDRLTRLTSSAPMRDVKTEVHVAVGSVEDEILDIVDRYRVDVIVMGTHGHSGGAISCSAGLPSGLCAAPRAPC
jgi:nucleotide-binding universal stress UspA family protein